MKWEEIELERVSEGNCVMATIHYHTDKNVWLKQIDENIDAEGGKDEAVSIVNDLAEWSKRYPRSRVFGYGTQPKMDGELIKLEERANQFLSTPKEADAPSMDNENVWIDFIKELAWTAWKGAANAYRMYPDNKHTFSDYWELTQGEFIRYSENWKKIYSEHFAPSIAVEEKGDFDKMNYDEQEIYLQDILDDISTSSNLYGRNILRKLFAASIKEEHIDLHDYLEAYGSEVLKNGWNAPNDFMAKNKLVVPDKNKNK